MTDSSSRKAPLAIVLVSALAGCLLLAGEARAQIEPRRLIENSYSEKSKAIAYGDHDARIELAKWCRQRGYIREMLTEIDYILEIDADHAAARALLLQQPVDGRWNFVLPETALCATEPVSFEESHSRRRKALDASPQIEFKEAKKAFRFEYWTDIDRERCSEYVKLMNSYYDRLKGFFQITKTELGIEVILLSRKADYLQFYNLFTGGSGEHVSGFFSFTYSFICFYDNPYDDAVFNTAKHECTHLLMKQCLRGARPAIWLDEGMACYFAGDGPERRGSKSAEYLLMVRRDLNKGAAIPLAELMEIEGENFKFRQYATAWSWIAYLHSQADTKKKLGQLLRRIRQVATELEDDEDSDLDEQTNSLFKKLFGAPERLQDGWTAWVNESLLPEGDSQKFEYAHQCLEHAYYGSKLSQTDRTHALREGEEWLRRAAESNDQTIVTRCALEKAFSILARARCMGYKEREMGYAAADAVSLVDEFLATPQNPSEKAALAFHAGHIAQRGLLAIWNAGDYEEDESPACDFDAILAAREGELVGKIKSKRTRASEKAFIDEELEFVGLHRICAQRLALVASCAYGRALAEDPAHRPAAHLWLLLALEFVPSELDAAFPHILAQVEIDPNDVNMAALAAAYAAMGKPLFGRTLLDRAYHMSADEKNLSHFARFVD